MAIFFLGLAVGKLVHGKHRSLRAWAEVAAKLAVLSVVSFLAMRYIDGSIQQTSRRMANLAYILWMTSLNSFILFVCLSGSIHFTRFQSSPIPKAVSQHQLLTFFVVSTHSCLLPDASIAFLSLSLPYLLAFIFHFLCTYSCTHELTVFVSVFLWLSLLSHNYRQTSSPEL